MESLAKSVIDCISWYKNKGPQSFSDLVLEQTKGIILCASGSRLEQLLVKGHWMQKGYLDSSRDWTTRLDKTQEIQSIS